VFESRRGYQSKSIDARASEQIPIQQLIKSLRSERSCLVAVLLAVTTVRVWVASTVGLGDAEAYYWTWSTNLDWSYYDHGPAVAVLIRLGTELLGPTPLGVRAPFIILSTATLWGLATLAKRIACEMALAMGLEAHTHAPGGLRPGLWALLCLLAMPAFQVAGGAANPDVPLLAATTFFLLALSRGGSLAAIITAGLVAGALGVCSKLFALALALPLLSAAWAHRQRLLALTAGLGALMAGSAPVVLWNLSHDGAGLLYHLVHRHSGTPPGPSWINLAKLVGGQLGYVSPILLVGLAATLPHLLRWTNLRPRPHNARILLWTTVALLVPGYLLILVVPSAEPHWPMTGYLPLLLVLAALLPGWRRVPRRRLLVRVAAGFSALVALALHLHVMTDLGVGVLRAAGTYEPRYDLGNELRGWPEVAAAVHRAVHTNQRAGTHVLAAGCHYTSCSQLAFAAAGRFEVVCPSPRVDQFDFSPGGDGSDLRESDLIYVKDPRFPFNVDQLYHCGSSSAAGSVKILRSGTVAREFKLQRCHGFQGLRAKRWPPGRSSPRD
jgi:hypothetical protein